MTVVRALLVLLATVAVGVLGLGVPPAAQAAEPEAFVTITLTTIPDLPVLEAHVETLTWSADGHTLAPTIHTTTGTAIPAWTPAVLEQTEAYPGGTISYVDTTYGPILCTPPQGTVIIDAAIATSMHCARV